VFYMAYREESCLFKDKESELGTKGDVKVCRKTTRKGGVMDAILSEGGRETFAHGRGSRG